MTGHYIVPSPSTPYKSIKKHAHQALMGGLSCSSGIFFSSSQYTESLSAPCSQRGLVPDASRQVSKQPPWRLLRPLTEAAATAGVHLLPLAQLHIGSIWLKPAKNEFTDSMGFHKLFSSNSQEIYIVSISGDYNFTFEMCQTVAG